MTKVEAVAVIGIIEILTVNESNYGQDYRTVSLRQFEDFKRIVLSMVEEGK